MVISLNLLETKRLVRLKLIVNITMYPFKQISRRNISFAGSEKDAQSGDNSVVENFPRCLFLIHEKISSSCKLIVNGIQASEENSSEFNLASPASSEYKFEVHDHYSEDPGIVETCK